MSINGQGHSLTLVKGHSDFKVKCLTFGLYTQVSDSGPLGPLFFIYYNFFEQIFLLYLPMFAVHCFVVQVIHRKKMEGGGAQ